MEAITICPTCWEEEHGQHLKRLQDQLEDLTAARDLLLAEGDRLRAELLRLRKAQPDPMAPTKPQPPSGQEPLQDLFIERLRERWARGARKYGDGSFARPLGSTRDELLAEVEDLAGWAFVLWVQLRQRLDRVLERAPAPATPPVKGCCE